MANPPPERDEVAPAAASRYGGAAMRRAFLSGGAHKVFGDGPQRHFRPLVLVRPLAPGSVETSKMTLR